MAKWTGLTRQHGHVSGWLSNSMPLLLTVVLAGSSYWLAWLSSLENWSDTPKGNRNTPDYFVEDFIWKRLLDNGNRRTQLNGQRIEHIPYNDLLQLNQPRLVSVSNQDATLIATSEKGSYNNLTGMLIMSNDVNVQRNNLKGDKLIIKSPQLSVDTDNQVAIAHQGAQVWMHKNSYLISEKLRVNNLDGSIEANRHVLLSIGSKNTAASPSPTNTRP
jgi:LPS export ABC transporter protein LptC